ncbi:MAG: hypothetical protein QXW41_08470 [Fervidicoccaceae archaeon]
MSIKYEEIIIALNKESRKQMPDHLYIGRMLADFPGCTPMKNIENWQRNNNFLFLLPKI